MSNIQIGTLRNAQSGGGYESTGESVKVDLSNQSQVKSAANDYFKFLDKATAHMHAENMMKSANESNDFGGYLIRNVIQNVHNEQVPKKDRVRIYNSEIDKAMSTTQKNTIYKSIQSAAKDFIEKDKQTKAGTNYWKKRGF